jgi:hypothetical protein
MKPVPVDPGCGEEPESHTPVQAPLHPERRGVRPSLWRHSTMQSL